MRRLSFVARLLALCVLLAPVVLGGCGEQLTATPVPALTPAPSPTAEPPLPPRLISYAPEHGQELRPDAPIVLRFDQEMEPATVERALHIAPNVAGRMTWISGSTLQFQPGPQGWERDTEYTVTVGTGARSRLGVALEEPESFTFRTVGLLEVAQVLPPEDADQVSTQTTIRVIFNRPVVPLTSIDDQVGLPSPLAFDPPLRGTGRWTNTSIYSFEPGERLRPGTRYTVRVRPGIEDATGKVLAQEYAWSFTTERPMAVSYTPLPGERHADPRTSVELRFSQPMQRQATQALFRLTDEAGAEVSGRFSWRENALVFTPSQPLSLGQPYRATLDAGAPALHGTAVTEQAVSWDFRVIWAPALVSSQPADGDQRADPESGITLAFTSPIDEATLLPNLVVTPTTELYAYWVWDSDSTSVYLSGALRASTDYQLTLGEGVVGRYGHALEGPRTIRFRTGPYSPVAYLDLSDRMATYNAYAKPAVGVTHVNVSRIDLALYALSDSEMLRYAGDDGWQLYHSRQRVPGQLLRRWSVPVTAPLNETERTIAELVAEGQEVLAPGYYMLEMSTPETTHVHRQVLVVSPWNLALKASESEALVWVTDLATGEVVEGVNVTAYDGQGQRVASASTDAQGIARLRYRAQEPWASLTVLAERDGQRGAVLREWSRGIDIWSYGYNWAPYTREVTAHIYTDRAIYRPGQAVRFKGVLRHDDDANYRLPRPGSVVNLTAYDGEWRRFWQDTVQLSDMGTFDGEIALSDEAGLGYYQIEAVYGDTPAYVTFQVAEYRKPEFEVSLTLDRDDYVSGDTIHASAEAAYYFGGPVADAPVRWTVMRQPYYFAPDDVDGYWDWHDWDYGEFARDTAYGEVVAEGEGRTDAQGRLLFALPADIAERKQSQVYTVEASITDINQQQVSTRSRATVHKGAFYIGLSPSAYVGTAGRPLSTRVLVVDPEGLPQAGRALEVTLYQHTWYSVREEGDDGYYYWVNRVENTPVVTQTVTSDASGRATVTVTPPEGGVYKLAATGRDAAGNQVASATYFWVSDRGYVHWGRQNHDRLELVADRKEYRPGDTAEILVPSPYEGEVMALVTVERGRVIEHSVRRLSSNSERLRLPITAEHAPNIYVSVLLVKGMSGDTPASFRMGYVMLPVSTEQRELTISLTPDRAGPYKPRDTVTYAIEATDYRGRGVEAELTLSMVDAAIEAIGGVSGGDIVQQFYRQRGLGISTATTLANSIDRRLLEEREEGKGGGGGEPGQPTVRQDLPDTAFWAPAVRTGADGRAQVRVRLPDNLTTWRLRAQAVTAQTEVGMARTDAVTRLDLMVRPAVPRFMVVGDRPLLGAVVHNNTARRLEATVTLQADGVSLDGEAQRVSLPAEGREMVTWPATVGAADRAVLRFTVTAGALGDAVELRLPVYRPTSAEVVGTSGSVDARTVERVRVPEAADDQAGELTVRLEPSLAASTREGLRYLEHFPYDCVEQTVSRWLPNVVTYRALRSLDLRDPQLEVRLPQQVGVGLQRLYAGQGLDGGWGWWAGQSSSPLITAYVLQGMAEAQRAGFVVDEEVMQRAAGYLHEWLAQPIRSDAQTLATRAAVLYALAEAGEGDLGRTVSLYEQRHLLPLHAKAYLAMTLLLLEPDASVRLDTIAAELWDAAEVTATGVRWSEAQAASWAMSSDTRTGAMVLRALVQHQPKSPLIAQAVRWLMTARSAGRWETTQENVWAILALTDYMLATGELEADYAYTLALNDAELAAGSVDATNLDRAVERIVPIADLARDRDNLVRIARTDGPGRLYYSAFLRYYLPVERVEARSRGIFVQRQYLLGGPDGRPVSAARAGDVLTVRLTLIAPTDLHYVVLEDPLPAGCEAIDTSLLTTSALAEGPSLVRAREDEAYDPWWWDWMLWAGHVELRDERVALFAERLPMGTYEYEYQVRCTTPGTYRVMPALAYEMYAPDVFGRTGGATFIIGQGD